MGPSILLSTVTETTAFALGALVPMPAVRNFALYAAGSVFLNALLQVTVFVSALVVDLKRVEVRLSWLDRFDISLTDHMYRQVASIASLVYDSRLVLLSSRHRPQAAVLAPSRVSSGSTMLPFYLSRWLRA